MSEEREFKSFEDLRRAAGGDPKSGSGSPSEKGGRDRGWTVESDDSRGPIDPDGLADPEGGARERIASRGEAFGPMEHGPPPYRDPESDEMELLSSFRLRTVFPADVLAEVEALPDDPGPKDFEGRLDLRGETVFTIDGPDAKDYDDAISIEALEDGGYRVGVHIADVGHYVRPGTALDTEALARATSVYLPDQVIPMLPEKLSNQLCSLVPERDRLAFSVFMDFDEAGTRTASKVAKSVIRSVHRNTYRVVQELLDGARTDETEAIRHLEQPLQAFQRWTRKQQSLRDQRGSMRIQSTERKFVFDDAHEVEAVVDAPRYFSQTLIEETALAANQAVGDLFRQKGLPTIYRVHPEKDAEEVAAVAEMLAEHGIRIPKKERLTGRDIGRMIRAARRQANAEALIQRIMSAGRKGGVRGQGPRRRGHSLRPRARSLPAFHIPDPALPRSDRAPLVVVLGRARRRSREGAARRCSGAGPERHGGPCFDPGRGGRDGGVGHWRPEGLSVPGAAHR